MRKFNWAVMAVALLATAACGSSGSSSTSSTTPSATSTKSMAANNTLMQTGFSAYTQVMTALGGGAAMVAKETDSISVECSELAFENYVCTATDGSGGSCTVSGSAETDYSSFAFTMDCNNFRPDSNTTIDGSFTTTVAVNESALAMTTKGIKLGKTVEGDTDGDGEADECTIDDDDTTYDDGACSEGGTCTAASADFLLSIVFTVGSGGLTLTDLCGTYVYAAGLTGTTNLCATETGIESGVFVVGFDIEGTFNGESADFAETWTCNYNTSL